IQTFSGEFREQFIASRLRPDPSRYQPPATKLIRLKCHIRRCPPRTFAIGKLVPEQFSQTNHQRQRVGRHGIRIPRQHSNSVTMSNLLNSLLATYQSDRTSKTVSENLWKFVDSESPSSE